MVSTSWRTEWSKDRAPSVPAHIPAEMMTPPATTTFHVTPRRDFRAPVALDSKSPHAATAATVCSFIDRAKSPRPSSPGLLFVDSLATLGTETSGPKGLILAVDGPYFRRRPSLYKTGRMLRVPISLVDVEAVVPHAQTEHSKLVVRPQPGTSMGLRSVYPRRAQGPAQIHRTDP